MFDYWLLFVPLGHHQVLFKDKKKRKKKTFPSVFTRMFVLQSLISFCPCLMRLDLITTKNITFTYFIRSCLVNGWSTLETEISHRFNSNVSSICEFYLQLLFTFNTVQILNMNNCQQEFAKLTNCIEERNAFFLD